MLGLLTLVLLALEIKLRVYPEAWGTPIYQLRIVQTALVSAIILSAQKTIQAGPAVDKKPTIIKYCALFREHTSFCWLC